MKDIRERSDIERMVNDFYGKVRKDPDLGYIFDEVARLDWDAHLPRMYAFWSSILLGEHGYSGNPMRVHLILNQKVPLSEKAFSSWIRLFNETVDTLFSGEKAEEAKMRAESIAGIMKARIGS